MLSQLTDCCLIRTCGIFVTVFHQAITQSSNKQSTNLSIFRNKPNWRMRRGHQAICFKFTPYDPCQHQQGSILSHPRTSHDPGHVSLTIRSFISWKNHLQTPTRISIVSSKYEEASEQRRPPGSGVLIYPELWKYPCWSLQVVFSTNNGPYS